LTSTTWSLMSSPMVTVSPIFLGNINTVRLPFPPSDRSPGPGRAGAERVIIP
jgi:hypothetical protein